ncbi:MAG: Sua5/YciO/YrdC/YwlC family protein [Acidobacteriota bacterium]
MKVIPVSDLNNRETLNEIRSHLESDGLLIYPTDTLYGIGCNFYSLKSQSMIDTVKGRKDVPYSVAIHDKRELKDLTSGSLKLLDPFSAAGSFSKMTFLFKLNENIDRKYVKNSNLIGIRIFNEGPMKALLEITGTPLITTSVNISGKPPVNSPESIKDFADSSGLSDEIYFIDNGILPDSKGSTIIDLSGELIKIVREGDNISTVMEVISKKIKL